MNSIYSPVAAVGTSPTSKIKNEKVLGHFDLYIKDLSPAHFILQKDVYDDGSPILSAQEQKDLVYEINQTNPLYQILYPALITAIV